MITSLSTSLLRVTLFWYVIGILVFFLGDPAWAEAVFTRLTHYPLVPELELHGLNTAAAVQWRLLVYWTVPVLILWVSSLGVGALVAEVQCQLALRKQRAHLKPAGEFWKVVVAHYSLGRLPRSTTPALVGQPVSLGPAKGAKGQDVARVELQGAISEAVKLLTAPERQLAEELLQLLLQAPDHYAGAGHGVGLLEHTLNVVTEAAGKVTSEFRLPLLAALSHDIGKLVTFQRDKNGAWVRRGLHSRESARILATLPAFRDLPDLHQRALLLAVKYDHAPSKMPELRGERDACTLAMRTISALAQADRKATADEKERHLERLQPEDLLWKDFMDFLREAPVVQRGKKGVANQVNNPPDSPYLFVYEAPWRDEAVRRLPAEVAAALDLTRRDAGKMAKYTRILVERLRREGVLVESYTLKDKDGVAQELHTSDTNPLWDIQSGTGEKAVVLRGILVLHADALWKKLNYRISVKSPFPVQILAPNADAEGRVNSAPSANRDEPRTPDVSDGLKLADVASNEAMASLGLSADPTVDAPKVGKPKTRARGGFGPAPVASTADDSVLGLKAGDKGAKPAAPAPAPAAAAPVAAPVVEADQAEVLDQEAQEMAELAAALAGEPAPEPAVEEDAESDAMSNALAFLTQGGDVADAGAPAEAAPENEGADVAVEEPVAIPAEPAVNPVIEAAAVVAAAGPAPVPGSSKQKAVKEEPKQAPTPAKKPKDAATKPSPDQQSAASATAAQQAPAPASASATPPGLDGAGDLSRAERREGLAVADAAAVAKYPSLTLGDKYYTEHSRAVQAGLKKPGSRYKGDKPEKALELTDSGPRRGRRRLTS